MLRMYTATRPVANIIRNEKNTAKGFGLLSAECLSDECPGVKPKSEPRRPQAASEASAGEAMRIKRCKYARDTRNFLAANDLFPLHALIARFAMLTLNCHN